MMRESQYLLYSIRLQGTLLVQGSDLNQADLNNTLYCVNIIISFNTAYYLATELP